LTLQALTSNVCNIYTSSIANNHEFVTVFLVDSKFNHMVINFTPINERLCVIRIPTNDSEEEAKDQFYEQLERAYATCPSHDVNLVMGDANAKVGRKTVHQPVIGKHSLHEITNENDLRLVNFAAGKVVQYVLHAQTNPPPNLALLRWTHHQPDRSLLDRRKTLHSDQEEYAVPATQSRNNWDVLQSTD
jgi:hypothetical protein